MTCDEVAPPVLAPWCLREVCARPFVPHAFSLSHTHMHTHTHTHTHTAMIRGKLVHLLRQYEQTIAHARGLHALHASRLASTMVPAPACFPRCAPTIVRAFACEGARVGLGENGLDGGFSCMKLWHESAMRHPSLPRLPPPRSLCYGRGVLGPCLGSLSCAMGVPSCVFRTRIAQPASCVYFTASVRNPAF